MNDALTDATAGLLTGAPPEVAPEIALIDKLLAMGSNATFGIHDIGAADMLAMLADGSLTEVTKGQSEGPNYLVGKGKIGPIDFTLFSTPGSL